MERILHVHNGSYSTPPNHLRFVCISDTHSRSFSIPNGDILIHAGDFTKKGTKEEVLEFASLLRRLPHRHKIIVAGNHDSPFDIKNYQKILSKKRTPQPCNPFAVKTLLSEFHYLEDSYTEVCGYKVWGTPWTVQHYLGAFTIKDEEVLAEKFSRIPNGVDIVVSHSPPYGIMDRTKDNRCVGAKSLKEAVERVKPIVHVFGHIHESHGFRCVDGVTYINASVCNNRYLPIFEPMVFDLPVIEKV